MFDHLQLLQIAIPRIVQLSMSVDLVSSTSNMQSKHFAPSAVSYRPLSFLINAGGGNRRVNVRSYGGLCFVSKSFSIHCCGRFQSALCGYTGCESTDYSFGAISGFSLRRSGIRFVSSCSLFRAVKGLGLQGSSEWRGGWRPSCNCHPSFGPICEERQRGRPFVERCSLNVPEGQFWLLLGPNGCGKSTLLKVAGEPTTPCDSCDGKGWLTCDFCEGQKVNVQAKNNRIYRRCPSCRTAGVVICPRCKVFKCVSFPDDKDVGIAL